MMSVFKAFLSFTSSGLAPEKVLPAKAAEQKTLAMVALESIVALSMNLLYTNARDRGSPTPRTDDDVFVPSREPRQVVKG